MRRCLALLLVIVACHNGASVPERPVLKPDELARVRVAVATRVALSTRAAWQEASGLRDDAPPAPEDTRWVLRPEVLTKVRNAAEDARHPDERRALGYLNGYLIGEALTQSTRELDARIAAILAAPLQEQNTSLANITFALGRTPDAPGRRELMRATLAPLQELEPLLTERAALERRTARALELPRRQELLLAQKGLDAASLRQRAEHLLLGSEALYQSLLREISVRELDLPAEMLVAADLPRLFSLATVLRPFQDTLWRPALDALGYAPSALPLRLDPAGPQASQRAACFPVRVPDDVRIVVRPQETLGDDAALLHELGHALHFAFTRAPALELAVLGDAAVSEASAFLLEGLLGNDVFLASLEVPRATRARLVPLLAWRRLAMARRLAAQVLLSTQESVTRADYEALMSRALAVRLGDAVESYLLDVDRHFYAADYFLGLLLAVQLEDHFITRYGEAYFQQAEVGELLRGFWHQGQAPRAEEVAEQITGAPLSDEALLRRVAKNLATPVTMTAESAIGR